MQMRLLPLALLKAAPYNPRVELQPGQPRYRKLRRSLERFGLVEPLVWNEVTGHVVGGHQRLAILRDLGVTEVPVSVVALPLEQEKALNIVLNNRAAQSDWDLPRLRELLDELAQGPEPSLAATGFDPGHLELLRQQLAPAPLPAAAESPRTVEILLRFPAALLDQVRGELDPLLARHGLECHVQWR